MTPNDQENGSQEVVRNNEKNGLPNMATNTNKQENHLFFQKSSKPDIVLISRKPLLMF